MPRRVSSLRFVGRAGELARGREVLSTLAAGATAPAELTARVLLISGEAGIGKSRLLEELLVHARAVGAITARGCCEEHGSEIRPLGAWRDLVDQLLARADDAVRYPDLVRLLTGGMEDSPALSGAAPARLHHQVRQLLTDISATAGLVLAVEDLHWADGATRALIAELARATALERVAIIATYRSDELHRRHPLLPLLADLQHVARPEQLELAPFHQGEIVELASSIAGEAVAAEAASAITRRSGGNPFYVEELLAAGAQGSELPTGVRHVILARSQGLSPDAIRCLESAAVLAAPIGTDVLEATADLDADRYRAAIDAVCQERFLVEDADGFRFRHDLVREVFLAEVLPGERTSLFARAADALQRLRPGQIGEIARLRFLAAQLDDALRASVQAAVAASAIGAPAEASEHYGRALDLWSRFDDPVRCAGISRLGLLRSAARAADMARDFDLAVELGRRAADEAAGTTEEGPVLSELADYLWNASTPGMEEVIERALAVIPKEPSAHLALLEIRMAGRLLRRGDHEASDAALERAAAMAAQLGERGIEANARAHIGYHRAELGDDTVLGHIYEALDLALSVDDGPAIGRICVNLSNLLVFLGRFEAAADLYETGVAAVERHGLMSTLGILFQGNVIEALEALGRWDEAGRIVDDINRRHTPDSLYRWASALSGWSQIQINRGQYDEAAPTYRRGWELHSSGYYTGEIGQLGTGLIELGAAGAAEPVVLETVDAWVHELPAGEATFGARMVAAAARHLVPPPGAPDHRRATELVNGWIDSLQEIADRQYVKVPRLLDAWLDQARSELAESQGQLDPDRWGAIAATWDADGCRFFAATARYRQAAAVLQRGGARSASDRAMAAELLLAAHGLARDLSAAPLARAVADVARRAHLRIDLEGRAVDGPREPTPDPPLGLTRRELEVLRLVTDGRSNGEIGTSLYISTKTASVHVSNILRKLGAANRIEAAAIARRHQL